METSNRATLLRLTAALNVNFEYLVQDQNIHADCNEELCNITSKGTCLTETAISEIRAAIKQITSLAIKSKGE